MARLLSLVISLVSWTTIVATAAATVTPPSPPPPRLPFCIPRGGASTGGGSSHHDKDGDESTTMTITKRSSANSIPSGGATSYGSQLEAIKASVLEAAIESIEELKTKIVNEASIVSDLGVQADTICNKALEDFAKTAPSASDSSTEASVYDRTLESLEAALDAPLQVLYLRQLSLLREQALQRYRAASKMSGSSEYEAMLQADAAFVRDAERATRDGSDWDYSTERSYLQSVMNSIAESGKKAMDIQLKSAQQSQTAMSFLQQQQQMIQQLQMQLYGQSSPWNVGVAYRIPDTNFNLQGSYQQGRANIQLSCVPDEYASMLGANGFTNGVGPGNLGLSLNLSI